MSEINYRAIRRRIMLRWLNRILFAVSLVLFVSHVLVPRYLQRPQDDFVRLIWFITLVIQGAFALKDVWPARIVDSLLQRQTEREAERLRAQGYVVHAPSAPREKPKRAARLSDDGEIEYEDEAFEDVAVRRSHNHE